MQINLQPYFRDSCKNKQRKEWNFSGENNFYMFIFLNKVKVEINCESVYGKCVFYFSDTLEPLLGIWSSQPRICLNISFLNLETAVYTTRSSFHHLWSFQLHFTVFISRWSTYTTTATGTFVSMTSQSDNLHLLMKTMWYVRKLQNNWVDLELSLFVQPTSVSLSVIMLYHNKSEKS